MYYDYDISEDVIKKAETAEQDCREFFERHEQISLYWSSRILKAFQKYNVSSADFIEITGYGYDDIAHERVAELRVGADLADVVIALVNREASAQGEDHDGDDERPEIELVAVSVGVFQIGLPARPFHSEQQEQPVSAVDDRVDALGNHRGASGYGGGDELDDADGDVRQNGRDDGAEALAMLLGLVRAGRHSVRGVECDIGVDQLSVYFSLHSASF